MAVFERPFLDLGDRIVAKALDDRIGVALLIEVLLQMSRGNAVSPHEIYYVFSAQEEVGARGATVAAFGIEPDLGLAVDLTASSGTPKGLKMAVELGKGPAIKVRDQMMLADPRVVDWMVSTANHAGIPYQIEILEIGVYGWAGYPAQSLWRARGGRINPSSLSSHSIRDDRLS